MIRLEEAIEVPRPIAEVFHYTSDFGNAAQWDPGVAESRKVSKGPIAVGTEFELRVRFGPRSIPMTYVVREYAPPKRVVLEGRGDSIHALDAIAFASIPGGTRITDGPFPETKEAIGGYVKLLASGLDEATEIARQHPALVFGMCIEVRQMTPDCHLGVNTLPGNAEAVPVGS